MTSRRIRTPEHEDYREPRPGEQRCQQCEGGLVWRCGWDPRDERLYPCEACDGTGCVAAPETEEES